MQVGERERQRTSEAKPTLLVIQVAKVASPLWVNGVKKKKREVSRMVFGLHAQTSGSAGSSIWVLFSNSVFRPQQLAIHRLRKCDQPRGNGQYIFKYDLPLLRTPTLKAWLNIWLELFLEAENWLHSLKVQISIWPSYFR